MDVNRCLLKSSKAASHKYEEKVGAWACYNLFNWNFLSTKFRGCAIQREKD